MTCELYSRLLSSEGLRLGQVFLVDFNPFGGLTQPLLFSWDELKPSEDGDDGPELRLVSSSTIRPTINM